MMSVAAFPCLKLFKGLWLVVDSVVQKSPESQSPPPSSSFPAIEIRETYSTCSEQFGYAAQTCGQCAMIRFDDMGKAVRSAEFTPCLHCREAEGRI